MENIIRVNAVNGISEVSRAITEGVRQNAHYHLFYSIYIWTKLLGFGYRN